MLKFLNISRLICSLQSFIQKYDLAAYATYVVCFNISTRMVEPTVTDYSAQQIAKKLIMAVLFTLSVFY